MILIIRYLHVFEWLGDYLETSLLILCFLWYTRKLKREEDDYFRGEIYLQWESKIMYRYGLIDFSFNDTFLINIGSIRNVYSNFYISIVITDDFITVFIACDNCDDDV